jgi:arylsulfatase A-like enzyme
LHPVIQGQEIRECAWSEWHVHPARLGVALELRAVRTAEYSYTFEFGSGNGELYNLQQDPEQMINHFEDPAWRDVRNQMHELLLNRPGTIRSDLAEPVGIA